MDNSAVIRQVWSGLEPLLEAHGFELVEVEIGGTGTGSTVLRLFIDRPGVGVRLDDCTEATRLVNPVLDTSDWFCDRYMLEVSSPGIDRPVRKESDFARFAGEQIRVQTHAPVAGQKKIRGRLEGFEDGLVRVASESGTVQIHIENVKRANLERMP
ncbi:MAG: hypothetical protein RLZZ303_489 [Candidatus Hydrogenedentota bacterium]